MRFALLMAMVAGLVGAQEKAAPAPVDKSNYETAIIPVKTLSGDSFQRLANMLRVFDAKYQADDKLRTIVVFAPKDVIAHMRKVIEALDRPGSEAAIGRNIDATLTFLKCDEKPAENSKPVPADMEAVAKQLRGASLCKEVYLWETVPLRLQEGKHTEHQMSLPALVGSTGFPHTHIRLFPEAVSRKETGRYVRLEQVRVNLRIPMGSSYQESNIVTAGDFKEGQKTVIGKASGAGQGTVFVVVEMKVLD